MINPVLFCNALKSNNIKFFTGIPDSLLKHFCECIDNDNEVKNIICSNEGAAIALAAGYYLSTNNIGVVYMQNSGLGNALNPLLSLTDKEVYSIPILIIIGWRGKPGTEDEPQHIKQGKITDKLLDVMDIPYIILNNNSFDYQEKISKAYKHCINNNEPFVLLIEENTFEPYKPIKKRQNHYTLLRENAIKIILENIDSDAIIVSTTGKISREIFDLRKILNLPHNSDFLTIGSMGHASQIALGIALNKFSKNIYCLDGDGAAIMHMGSMSIIGTSSCINYKHIIINNGAHESVGGQSTVGFNIDFKTIAKGCGYKAFFLSESENDLIENINNLKEINGPALLEIRVKLESRKDLGRPTTTPIENKIHFMNYLKK